MRQQETTVNMLKLVADRWIGLAEDISQTGCRIGILLFYYS